MASAGLSAAEHVSGNVGLLLNVSEGMVTKDMDRVEVLNIFAFGSSNSLRLVGEVWSKTDFLSGRGPG